MKKGVTYTIGGIAVLIISVVAFVLPSSLGRAVQNQDEIVFGSYDGKEIKYAQNSVFNNNLSYWYNYFTSLGIQPTSDNQYTLYNYAFNSSIAQLAYTSEVEKSGYIIPEEAINRQMRANFSDENGNFSQKLYNQAPESFVESIRKSIVDGLTQNRFRDDYFGSTDEIIAGNALYGLKASNDELDFLSSFGSEKRGFQIAAFNKGDYPEEEKIKFGKENSAKFIKYDLSVLTYNDETEAKKAANDLAASTITFEDAVVDSTKVYSDMDGKLTNAYQYQLENILEDKADLAQITSLPLNVLSSVIKTVNGYSIFKQNTAAASPDFESNEIKDRITTYINTYESGVIESYYLNKASEFINTAKTTDFESACEAFDIIDDVIPPFPMNYGSVPVSTSVDTSITGLKGADENENFLKTAFSLKMNDLSEPMVIGDYVVVVKYTQSESADADEEAQTKVVSQIEEMDMTSAQNAIMESDKLVNNFSTVYFDKFFRSQL